MKGDSRDDMSQEFARAFQGRLAQRSGGRGAEAQGRVPGEDKAPDLRAPGAAESLAV